MGLGAMGALGIAAFSTSIPRGEMIVDGIPERLVRVTTEAEKASEPEIKRPTINSDAGEGAKAKKEEGKVGKREALRAEVESRPMLVAHSGELDRRVSENAGVMGALRDAGDLDGVFGSSSADAHLTGAVGGLIGSKGMQIGSGGLGARGSGLGGGGGIAGLGGLGSKGIGGGRSGYGGLPPYQYQRPLSQDVVDYGYNPVELTEKDFLSTFSIDVDTGSYTQARRSLRNGQIPTQASVRTEEFINFLQYEYPEPERGLPFSVTMEATAHPWNPTHHIMRVGIQGASLEATERKPVHLTFLVDTSCSMSGPDRLPLAKQALHHLVDNLSKDDTVALATYSGSTRAVLDPSQPGWGVHKAIDALSNGGGTAMASGMNLAYGMAKSSYVEGHENRVIVLSDGDANIGGRSHEQILESLARHARDGITLSTVGFGTGNYRDTMMEQLANKGDGNYQYIDSFQEAKRVFGEDLDATLRTIARDVKIQVAFDPENVIAYKLIGYENREIADEDFRNDKVDAGEVGAGHTVTAMYDLVLRDNTRGTVATVQVRHKKPGKDSAAKEQAVKLPASAVGDHFWFSSPSLRLAWGAASFAEKLRGAKEMEEVEWDQIIEVLDGARRGGTERDDEMLGLARAVANLRGGRQMSQVTGGDPLILGAMNREELVAVVNRHMNQIQYCYQRELRSNPTLSGKIVQKFVIANTGEVTSAHKKTSTVGSSAVEDCVTGRFMRMKFPPRMGAGMAIVSYPLVFPAG